MLEKVITDSKYSVRSIDENGYMHVEKTPISKATVNPYKGSELQGLTDIKLDPERIYYGYRDPKELAKGADTFNGLFLFDCHHDVDSMSIPKEYIIGTVGTDAEFKDGYLYNSLVIADQEAINNVEDKSKWEISSAYKFVPVFKEGEVETEGGEKIHYDFVMTNIRGNHVALVPEGRAGHDVRVADSKGELKKMEKKPICSADALKGELCEIACINKLTDIVERVASLNLDIEIEDVIKNKADKIIAIVMKNDGHTFNVGYDDKGSIRVCELISDDDAVTVFNAYTKGLCEAHEQQLQDCEIKRQAECIAQEKLAEQASQAPSVVVVEQPNKVEEVVSAEISPKPITEEVVSLIADTPAVVADDNEELAETAELKHKDDEFDEKAYLDIKERFTDARFNNFDDFVKEIGKYGVSVGKVTVVESGVSYSAECDKGQKKFTVEFKQTPCCVEVDKVYDDKQIAESELKVDEAPVPNEEDVEANQDVAKEVGPKAIKDTKKKVIKDTKKKVAKDKATEDGGPGSGRKPGSKNKNSIGKTLKAGMYNGNKAIDKAKKVSKEQYEKSLLKDNPQISAAINATKSRRPAKLTPISSVDSKKKVKGCVGDALVEQGSLTANVPQEEALVSDVFGLLMNVLGDDFKVEDGGPGSGRKPGFGTKHMDYTPAEKANIKQKFAPVMQKTGSEWKQKNKLPEYVAEKDLKHRVTARTHPEKNDNERMIARMWRNQGAALDKKVK